MNLDFLSSFFSTNNFKFKFGSKLDFINRSSLFNVWLFQGYEKKTFPSWIFGTMILKQKLEFFSSKIGYEIDISDQKCKFYRTLFRREMFFAHINTLRYLNSSRKVHGVGIITVNRTAFVMTKCFCCFHDSR